MKISKFILVILLFAMFSVPLSVSAGIPTLDTTQVSTKAKGVMETVKNSTAVQKATEMASKGNDALGSAKESVSKAKAKTEKLEKAKKLVEKAKEEKERLEKKKAEFDKKKAEFEKKKAELEEYKQMAADLKDAKGSLSSKLDDAKNKAGVDKIKEQTNKLPSNPVSSSMKKYDEPKRAEEKASVPEKIYITKEAEPIVQTIYIEKEVSVEDDMSEAIIGKPLDIPIAASPAMMDMPSFSEQEIDEEDNMFLEDSKEELFEDSVRVQTPNRQPYAGDKSNLKAMKDISSNEEVISSQKNLVEVESLGVKKVEGREENIKAIKNSTPTQTPSPKKRLRRVPFSSIDIDSHIYKSNEVISLAQLGGLAGGGEVFTNEINGMPVLPQSLVEKCEINAEGLVDGQALYDCIYGLVEGFNDENAGKSSAAKAEHALMVRWFAIQNLTIAMNMLNNSLHYEEKVLAPMTEDLGGVNNLNDSGAATSEFKAKAIELQTKQLILLGAQLLEKSFSDIIKFTTEDLEAIEKDVTEKGTI